MHGDKAATKVLIDHRMPKIHQLSLRNFQNRRPFTPNAYTNKRYVFIKNIFVGASTSVWKENLVISFAAAGIELPNALHAFIFIYLFQRRWEKIYICLWISTILMISTIVCCSRQTTLSKLCREWIISPTTIWRRTLTKDIKPSTCFRYRNDR